MLTLALGALEGLMENADLLPAQTEEADRTLKTELGHWTKCCRLLMFANTCSNKMGSDAFKESYLHDSFYQ